MVNEEKPSEAVALKAAVAILAVAFIAAPAAYGAYEINGLSSPAITAWRWPLIGVLGVFVGLLAWWVVLTIRRNFPYS